MGIEVTTRKLLGINGLGRVGKLTLWHHLQHEAFDGFVVNLGRGVGTGLEDVVNFLGADSTYGSLERFLHGVGGERQMKIIDAEKGLLEIHGKPVTVLRKARNPAEIGWRREGVRTVIDCTGAFTDPAADPAKPNLRGHLESGAQVVVTSAPFKIKDKSRSTPDDAAMLIYGINHTSFDPRKHRVVSAASCTTTGLAHMLKPLLECSETSRILTASMSTIHAATNTQSVLDSVPSDKATDLRKNRAVFNNIILSTTGAASALETVLPQIQRIGFMADSVRVPTSTVSLINLNLTLHSPLDDKGEPVVTRRLINDTFRRAAEGAQKGLLIYSDRQNVSADLIGLRAAVVIEGHENHTRVGFIEVPAEELRRQGIERDSSLRVPVTHAKIFGWYDNEYGSYVYCLSELAAYLDRAIG